MRITVKHNENWQIKSNYMSESNNQEFHSIESIEEYSDEFKDCILTSPQTESSLTSHLEKEQKKSSLERFSQTEQYTTLKNKMNTLLWESISKNDQDTVTKLLDPEKYSVFIADTNAKGLDKWTALHIASALGYKQICKIMIKLAPDTKINAKTSLKRTPLHLATFNNNLKVVKFLIKSGADINLQDVEKNTPLHLASMQGNLEIVELLMQKSPDFSKNCLNRTAFCVSLNHATYFKFIEYFSCNSVKVEDTGYRRNLVCTTLFHNSREDCVQKILSKCSQGVNCEQLKHFRSRKVVHVNKKVNKLVLPPCKVGPKDFKGLSLLGRGSFGEVYLVEKIDTKEKFALKVLKKENLISNNIVKYAFTERNILLHTNHPFIVKLHYAFQTPEKLAMVMDFCPCGDLSMYLTREKNFSEEKARFYLCEIILALGELHKNGVLFRDLKPENVVIDETGHAKLTDFGLSKENTSDEILSKSFCGSIAYLAPEMIRRSGHTRSVDWYLLGVLLYEMVCGSPPFYSSDREQMFSNIQKTEVSFAKELTPECKRLIRDLMNKDPKYRLGSSKKDFEEVKVHQYFAGVDWDAVLRKEVKPPEFRILKRVPKEISSEKIFGKLEIEASQKLEGWSILQPSFK